MTVVQIEIYNYCRALGMGEASALKAAAALRTRRDLAMVQSRIRLLGWILGAALLATGMIAAFA